MRPRRTRLGRGGLSQIKEEKELESYLKIKILERWLSGLKRHRAKVLSGQPDRGFKSHPFRIKKVCY